MYAHPERGSTGDAEAFTALYERYRLRLVAYCHRRLHNRADAEDAAHEAMFRAYRAFATFDDGTDAWPWLATIAARVCTDMRRRAGRAPAEPPPSPAHDVHDEAVVRLRAALVDEALGRLPPRYRTPLVLHEFGGWTYDEIARAQGKTMSSVRSVVARSRRRLGEGVEALARGRGQWPLPGAVPGFVRRVRSQARVPVDRLVHVAVIGFDSVLCLGGTHVTRAAAVVGLAIAGGALPGTGGAPPGWPPPARGADSRVGAPIEAAAAELAATVATVQQTADTNAARVATDAPSVAPTGSTLIRGTTEAVVVDPEVYIRVRYTYRAEAPVVGERYSTTEVNIGCFFKGVTNPLCPVARTGLDKANDIAP